MHIRPIGLSAGTALAVLVWSLSGCGPIPDASSTATPTAGSASSTSGVSSAPSTVGGGTLSSDCSTPVLTAAELGSLTGYSYSEPTCTAMSAQFGLVWLYVSPDQQHRTAIQQWTGAGAVYSYPKLRDAGSGLTVPDVTVQGKDSLRPGDRIIQFGLYTTDPSRARVYSIVHEAMRPSSDPQRTNQQLLAIARALIDKAS